MDTLSISPTKAATAAATAAAPAQQPTAAAPTTTEAPAASVGVAARQTGKKTETTAEPKSESTPERDSRSLQYLVQGNRVITTIVDDQSKKVVVQIPDAELIRIAKSIDRMQGFFIEQKA